MALTSIDGGTAIELEVRINGKSAPLGGEMAESTFATGSRGYMSTGKVNIGGKVYQCNLQFVEVGSKPGSAAASKNGPVIVTRPASK